jgi:hypothetical protein
MKLGILVNTDAHLDDILGVISAALAKGHTVAVFTMDRGTRLLREAAYSGLCERDGISMSFCDHSSQEEGVATEGLPRGIVCGSQYDNAVMVHDSDKVIVL